MDSNNPPSPSEDMKVEPMVEKTEDERKREKMKLRRAKQAECKRRARANQSEEQRRLTSEKRLWRRRIQEGHPSITGEKLLELEEKYGLDVEKLLENENSEMGSGTLPNLSEGDVKIEPTVEKTEEERKREQRIRRLAKQAECSRKARAKQTAEKRRLEAEKHLWRRRIRQGHPSVTEEKLMELKEKYGIDVDNLRSKYTPENQEIMKKIDAEKRRKRNERFREMGVKKPRKPLSKEQQEEKNARKRFQALEKRLQMTEEEKQQQKIKNYFSNQAYYARRGKWSDLPREYKDRVNARLKKWKENLTPEARKRYNDSVRRTQKRYQERLKAADPQYQSKNSTEYWKKVKSEDIGKWRKYRERVNDYQRKKYQQQTEEERIRWRYKDKVNGVKRKLKKTLEQEGLDAGDIEKRLKEVHERMWKEFDPEWTWQKYGRKSKYTIHKETPTNASGVLSAPSRLPPEAPSHVEDRPIAMYSSLKNTIADLHTCASSTPPETPLNTQEGVYETFQLINTEHEHQDTGFSNVDDDHEYESESARMDNFPSPSPSPSPVPVDDTSFQETQTLSDHDPSPVATTFKCTFCTLEFFEDGDLRDHMRETHTDKVWMCPKCKAVVLSSQELSSHFQSVHKAPSKPEPKNIPTRQSKLNFFCMRCCPVKDGIVGFSTRLELFTHVKKNHKRQSFWPCDRCLILKYSAHSLEVHQTICRVSKPESNLKRGKVKR